MVPLTYNQLAMHHPTGSSTGYMEEMRGNWSELVEAAERTSTFAAELAALSEPEFGKLRDFLVHDPPLPFRYLSVHAPVKEREAPENDLVDWLLALPLSVNSIVTHPEAIDNPVPYLALGSRLVIENMDARKSGGRTPDELAPLFSALPRAGFCFDIAHAWSVDESMDLAHELLTRFGTRLRQVHLSSLQSGKHVPILPEHDALFASVLDRCRDVPWILEAERPTRWLPQAA
jgi:hypothetical protein